MAEESTRIKLRNIEDEMKDSYLDYSMSVIVGRALPDVRDGLKPVHRRILYAMQELGLFHNKSYKKCARVVGETLGKFHPHGDTAVYDSMARMVQDFSLRYTLLDGQGNFGSVDGDPPAAMRYTEIRMAKIASEMLQDINKETVNFIPNFDGSLEEPTVLPARIPNLLINGSSGIAVGMATNIPPHNMSEICDGITLLIDKPDVTVDELSSVIKGPDFPTGGIIYGRKGIKDALKTGRGSIKIRAKMDIEPISSGRERIIVNEIPYQVNKASLLENIANLVREKKIEGISNLRDESDRQGMRVVIELRRDENAQVILNKLYKHTALESSFGIIMLSLIRGVPKVLNIKEMLDEFVSFRKEIVTRRTEFDLKKAEDRAHILEGLKIALDNINQIIKVIKSAKDQERARESLMKNFKLSKIQAQAILDMRLHQLTGLEREKIEGEYLEKIKEIEKYKSILASPKKITTIIENELKEVKEKYGDKRKTKIVAKTVEFDVEDLIEKEDVVVTISHAGYIKRIPLEIYRAQKRGGRGIVGMGTKEEDFIEDIFIGSSHSYVLFFTNFGRLYWLRAFEIPEASRTSKGKAIINLLRLSSNQEKITAMIPIDDLSESEGHLLMATTNGTVKKTLVSQYSNPRPSGIIAIKLNQGDSLIDVKNTTGKDEVILATKEGKAIRFKEEEIREVGRSAKGVRGMRLEKDDAVIGMEVVSKKDTFLVATEHGHGKRTVVDKYRLQSRGGKGVINIKTSKRNGRVIGVKKVTDNDEIILITQNGIINRQPVKDIRRIGRATQGVRLIRLEEGDRLASIAHIANEEINNEKV